MINKRKGLEQEIVVVASTIADLLISHDSNIPIKNSKWTIGSAGAHLVISQDISKKILLGEKNPYENADPEIVADTNAKLLNDFSERDGKTLSKMLFKNTEAFLESTKQYKDDHLVQTHFGTFDMLTCLSYNLCHLLIHGTAMTMSLQKPLLVQKKYIPMVLPFLKTATLATYNTKAAENFSCTYAMHIRNGESFAIICKGETVIVEDKIPQKVDCHISIDPVTYFLLATGLTTQWKPFFTGKILIIGSKPWLALRLLTLFRSP